MLPAMTLAGSGNHGIAAGIPIVATAGYTELHQGRGLMHAVTLSYLVTCSIKALTGRLSAMCGCAVASGAGVAAGVAYLLGGTVEEIGGALVNHLESTAMLICDGAKTGCALKVGEAVASAVKSALLSLQGAVVRPTDGFIGRTVEDTLRHLGTLSNQGLAATFFGVPSAMGGLMGRPWQLFSLAKVLEITTTVNIPVLGSGAKPKGACTALFLKSSSCTETHPP